MKSQQQTFSLLKATTVSVVVALFALVLFILPAEYDIDLTGSGAALGLTTFAQAVEPSLATDSQQAAKSKNAKSDPAESEPADAVLGKDMLAKDLVQLTVPAGRGIEYKLHMNQFEQVTYDWMSDSAEVYVDLHGEPKGDTTGYFKSYTIATVDKMNGSFTAPFDGVHGWYWKNKSANDVLITLKFEGRYTIKGLIK